MERFPRNNTAPHRNRGNSVRTGAKQQKAEDWRIQTPILNTYRTEKSLNESPIKIPTGFSIKDYFTHKQNENSTDGTFFCSSEVQETKVPYNVFVADIFGLLEKKNRLQEELRERPKIKKAPSSTVFVVESLFINREPTLLFDYPAQCRLPSRVKQRVRKLTVQEKKLRRLNFKISEQVHTYNSVVNACKFAGLSQTSTSRWNVHFGVIPKIEFLRNLNANQKVNHFPTMTNLGRKDKLWKFVNDQRKKFGKIYQICPQTFVLPEAHWQFQAEKDNFPNNLWILKPAAQSCGRGIRILQKNSALPKERCVVSRYLSNPHLINGYKYDLRLYVLVSSYDPLRVYLYQEGLVRFATEPYNLNKTSISNKCVHLTNFSVNKHSNKFVKNENPLVDNIGNKWSFSALKTYLQGNGVDVQRLIERISDVVIKALIAVEPQVYSALLHSNSRQTCFEVYGFDIMVDDSLKPWLLEVNTSPSLSNSSPLDKKIKTSLMADTLTLIGVVPFLRADPPMKTVRKTARNQGGTENLDILMEFVEEQYRKGRYQLIFPTKENVKVYSQFFEFNRTNNILLWNNLNKMKGALKKYRVHPYINI